MARDLYETTVALPDATGTLKVLEGINVSVVPRGAQDVPNSLVDIYVSDTGMTLGPDPKSGATGTRVITTGSSGSVRFWAEAPAEYDLVFEDPTVTPPRINDRIGWNAVPAKPGTFPTSSLKADGGITQKMLSAEVIRQEVPIGGVIDWWRPAPSGANPPAAYPDGFEVCDGHPVNQHDFPGTSGSISTPDLRNVMILGASLAKNDTTQAAQDDGFASAPGIRGAGGSNKGKDVGHTHSVPIGNHTHNVSVGNHQHSSGSIYAGDHAHAAAMGAGGYDAAVAGQAGGVLVSRSNHAHSVWTGNASAGTGGWTDLGGAFTVGSGYVNEGGFFATTAGAITWDAGAKPSIDFRPAYYGLLKIIKVRRA